MKVVLQRVCEASVTVRGMRVGEIGVGFLLLIGVAHGDQSEDADYLATKIATLRVFSDPQTKKMNLALDDVGGAVLAVPQFTLLGNCRRGRRPDFTQAADPTRGRQLFEEFCHRLRQAGCRVEMGSFREHMQVTLVNDGPVTLTLDSRER